VEVSSDGKKFYRFPAFSETDTSIQVGTFGSLKAEKIHNLAGKYIMPYGVPFDLADLKDSLEIPGKTTEIKFIRLIDVIGSIRPEYASRDLLGRIINDPWPTPFPSGGFDLSGIGFIHTNILGNTSEIKIGDNKLNVYPNPIADNSVLHIESKIAFEKIIITDSNGKFKLEKTGLNQTLIDLELQELHTGIFFVQLAHANQSMSFFKLIKL
ncbi:MAG: T9SS type A sorting domain-containing protein, partial [Bacteroidia bacterium]|nr:T9SS type A sorting domain-containing protein [Bacteroidia bacterium]